MTQDERYNVLRTNYLCHKCLSSGHRARDCPEGTGCDFCPGRFHHTLMHRDYQKKENDQKEEGSDDSSDSTDNEQ